MKGNKMSAILAILLMLSGVMFIPHAFGVIPPADAVTANPTSIDWTNPPHTTGETFKAYVDVVNVVGLLTFQVGFYFNPVALQVDDVKEGGFLWAGVPASKQGSILGSIDNTAGVVSAYLFSVLGKNYNKTGSGHLIEIDFHINQAYSGTLPGSFVPMITLSTTDITTQLILIYADGVTDITPTPDHVYSGTFRLQVVPSPPIAAFTITPPTVYLGTEQKFDASGSLPGSDGINPTPIVNYHWDFDDTNITDTATPIIYHTYASSGTFTVTLTVRDSIGQVSAPVSHPATVQEIPTGCNLDLYSQNWRYIDPITLTPVPNGALANAPCDLFRPGDYVQLFANTTYGGDVVQGQLVSFQVFDNFGNIVLVGTAISNAYGVAEYDFRVPWPCTGVTDEFGTWTVVATWQCGSTFPDVPPWEKTQIDTMPFKVGWGLWIVSVTTDKSQYYKSENVVVKITVENDYMVAVTALVTADIYDNLLVPINGPAFVFASFNPGTTLVTEPGIHVEKWAFVGTSTAKANIFTTWPSLMGTSFCPEVTATFTIKKS
jgi:PKD repeat protein